MDGITAKAAINKTYEEYAAEWKDLRCNTKWKRIGHTLWLQGCNYTQMTKRQYIKILFVKLGWQNYGWFSSVSKCSEIIVKSLGNPTHLPSTLALEILAWVGRKHYISSPNFMVLLNVLIL